MAVGGGTRNTEPLGEGAIADEGSDEERTGFSLAGTGGRGNWEWAECGDDSSSAKASACNVSRALLKSPDHLIRWSSSEAAYAPTDE